MKRSGGQRYKHYLRNGNMRLTFSVSPSQRRPSIREQKAARAMEKIIAFGYDAEEMEARFCNLILYGNTHPEYLAEPPKG